MCMCIFSFIARAELVSCNYVKPDLIILVLAGEYKVLPCGPFGFIHTFLASAMSLHISVHASYMMHTEHDQVYLHCCIYSI